MNKLNVSVVMAVKNESKYIVEAVQSILSQELIDFELVVVDDNSEDDTFEKLLNIKNSNNNLSILSNNGIGKVAAFNFGVHAARGRFICLFAGDDVMPQYSLYERFKQVENFPDNKPVAGLSKLITLSDDTKFDRIILPRKTGKGSTSGQSPLMNRCFVSKFFPIPESLPNEDTWLEIAIDLSNLVKVVHSSIICCQWRIHDANSIPVNLDYESNKKRFHKRMLAYSMFMNTYQNQLERRKLYFFRTMSKFIELSEENVFNRYLLSPLLPLRIKLRFIVNYNKILFSIKQRYYMKFTGW
jgi:glycosyltransferase involved in cell wall biosynthesis